MYHTGRCGLYHCTCTDLLKCDFVKRVNHLFLLLQLSMPFPSDGLVYDYRRDDGGVSRTGRGEEDEEEDDKRPTKIKVRMGTEFEVNMGLGEGQEGIPSLSH